MAYTLYMLVNYNYIINKTYKLLAIAVVALMLVNCVFANRYATGIFSFEASAAEMLKVQKDAFGCAVQINKAIKKISGMLFVKMNGTDSQNKKDRGRKKEVPVKAEEGMAAAMTAGKVKSEVKTQSIIKENTIITGIKFEKEAGKYAKELIFALTIYFILMLIYYGTKREEGLIPGTTIETGKN